jgi:hypothetical protein
MQELMPSPLWRRLRMQSCDQYGQTLVFERTSKKSLDSAPRLFWCAPLRSCEGPPVAQSCRPHICADAWSKAHRCAEDDSAKSKAEGACCTSSSCPLRRRGAKSVPCTLGQAAAKKSPGFLGPSPRLCGKSVRSGGAQFRTLLAEILQRKGPEGIHRGRCDEIWTFSLFATVAVDTTCIRSRAR